MSRTCFSFVCLLFIVKVFVVVFIFVCLFIVVFVCLLISIRCLMAWPGIYFSSKCVSRACLLFVQMSPALEFNWKTRKGDEFIGHKNWSHHNNSLSHDCLHAKENKRIFSRKITQNWSTTTVSLLLKFRWFAKKKIYPKVWKMFNHNP